MGPQWTGAHVATASVAEGTGIGPVGATSNRLVGGSPLQLPFVMSRPGIHPVRRPLIALGAANLICLRLQQCVRRLLDARSHHLIHVSLQLRLIDLQRSKRRRCIVLHGGLSWSGFLVVW
jgi:hypothetical protein